MFGSTHCSTKQQQIEEWHQEMYAVYDSRESGLKEKHGEKNFGPNELKMVAEKLLGRAIRTNPDCDVLRATIEFAFGLFKGSYGADIYNKASNLYFDVPPLAQECNVFKRLYVHLDQFMPIKYLPLTVFFPINQSKQLRQEFRNREIVACMTHLSRLNFFNCPFTKDEQATIQQFKFKQTIQNLSTIRVRCFKKIDEKLADLQIGLLAYIKRTNGLIRLKNRLTSWSFKHALIGTLMLIGTKGLVTLMNTTGYNTWRNPNDLANLNTDITDTTDFCHYFINYPSFEAVSHTLDPNLKNNIMDGYSKLFLTCQKNPINSRILYITPHALLALNSVLLSTLFLLRKIAVLSPRLFDVLQELILFKLNECILLKSSRIENSKKDVKEHEVHVVGNEIDLLKNCHGEKINSLLNDFNELRSEAKTTLEIQHYQKIATQLQANKSRILKHFNCFKQNQRLFKKINKAFSKASKI